MMMPDQTDDGTMLLVPVAGFVVKTYKTSAAAYEASGKVFVNVCSHESIERAQGSTGMVASDDHLDNRGLSNLQIPLLVGPARSLQDSSGMQATAVDVIFHPSLVTRAKTGSAQFSADHFRGYLVDLALKNVAEELKFKIERFKIQFLEKLTYKGAPGENSNNTRAFEVFNKATRQPKKPTPEPGKPKIEVIGELKPKRAKPIIRKGFFDKPNKLEAEEAELYPDGSAEGIQEPGQGDAINFVDQGLRDKAHYIDPSKMTQSDLEATMRAYAETGRVDGNVKGVYKKGERNNGAPEVGIGHPSYLRNKGSSTSAKAAGSDGEGAKKEAAAAADTKPVEDSLFKFVGQLEEPVHRIEETASGGSLALAVTVELPRIESMRALKLDVTEKQLQVRGAMYRLKLDLPNQIDPNTVKAKFNSKRKELKVTLTVTTD